MCSLLTQDGWQAWHVAFFYGNTLKDALNAINRLCSFNIKASITSKEKLAFVRLCVCVNECTHA